MLTKASFSGLLFFLLLLQLEASAQSIEPATLNAGGGSVITGNYLIDWSIGEGAAIETFETASVMVTAGVLQPLTEKSGLLENLTFPWFRDEISIYPVPTHTILTVNIKITQYGQVTMHLFDQRGRNIQTKIFDYTGDNGVQKIDMTNMTSGIYYLNVILGGKPVYPIIRKGTFKIQKT